MYKSKQNIYEKKQKYIFFENVIVFQVVLMLGKISNILNINQFFEVYITVFFFLIKNLSRGIVESAGYEIDYDNKKVYIKYKGLNSQEQT